MPQLIVNSDNFSAIGGRVDALFSEYQKNTYERTDRMFAVLMIVQLFAGIAAAVWLSPRTWIAAESQIHLHVWASIFLGTIISLFPIVLALIKPGETYTRYIIAVGQMLMGALLIHLNGGRIETHFHIFGSLAFLAFYRDWRVLVPATLVVVADHALRGMFFPQSIFGVLTATNWRWLEHTGWVVFIDIFLVISCLRGKSEMQKFAEKTTALETAERKSAMEIGEEKYRELFENANDLIFTHDLEGNFTSVNKTSERITGYLREEAVKMNVNQIIAPESMEYARQMTTAMVKDRMPVSYEMAVITKDGGKVWLDTSTRLIYKDDVPFGIQGISRDITERRRIEEELQRTRDAALESVRIKSEFLANMSHEIRTPMNGVIGMTGVLLDTELNEEQRDCAIIIQSSADGLLRIIDDILDFSKIEAGQLNFEKIDFDLRECVESATELLAGRAQSKQLEIASIVYRDVPTLLCGDPGRLSQVLTNLVGNAIKFTEKGEVTVNVRTQSDEGKYAALRFEVTDTGIGISEQAQRRLFQAFVQADGSTTRQYGGTGLGLAISKQLVEMMGGEIGIESEPGKGTTFWFTARFEKQVNQVRAINSFKDVSLNGVRVLIVDDNATNRKIFLHQTSSWGMISAEADGGANALKLMRTAAAAGEAYEIVILDLMMPEMDGFQLARAIKCDPVLAAAHLVLLPSNGRRGDGELAKDLGIAAYLQKPVRQSQLYNCLLTVIAETLNNTLEHESPRFFNKHSLIKQTVPNIEPENAVSHARILIAEDNAINQKVAVRQVQKLGCLADVVGNGFEALAALAENSYDIVLMDCQMPLMDGYQTTAEIRRREVGASRHTVIIAMTANAMEGDREQCLAAGMDDYIGKPIRVKEFQETLSRWIKFKPAEETLKNEIEAVEEASDTSILNGLRRLRDEDAPDAIAELIELYLVDAQTHLAEMRTALEKRDVQSLQSIARGLEENSGKLGVRPMSEICAALEKTLKSNNWEEIGKEICRLESEFSGVREQLEREGQKVIR